MDSHRTNAAVTLGQAKALLHAMAAHQSILLLSPPGLGKSDIVRQAAAEAGLELRSLLGTQIAPEDVSGVPRIIGERSVFCPPRVLLPERPEPFCLFLDELPATTPDVQKAFYSLLLERRLGEHRLPEGTWVVAAGNRVEDRAMVRALSSALVNRVFMIEVESSVADWLAWAEPAGIRADVRAFINFQRESLMREVPAAPVPFSTPRAWASLSQALDLAERAGLLSAGVVRALAFARISAEDAALFATAFEFDLAQLQPPLHYIRHPEQLPDNDQRGRLWLILNAIRDHVWHWVDNPGADRPTAAEVNTFLEALVAENRFAVLVDRVEHWHRLGAREALLDTIEITLGG